MAAPSTKGQNQPVTTTTSATTVFYGSEALSNVPQPTYEIKCNQSSVVNGASIFSECHITVVSGVSIFDPIPVKNVQGLHFVGVQATSHGEIHDGKQHSIIQVAPFGQITTNGDSSKKSEVVNDNE